MDIKTEEMDIPEDESVYCDKYQANSTPLMVEIESPHVNEVNESIVYTPLNTVKLDKMHYSRRTSNTLIKSPPCKLDSYMKNNDRHYSPKKPVKVLGAIPRGRLGSQETSNINLNVRSQTVSTELKIIENIENKNIDDCNESEVDMFLESQEYLVNNESVNNINNGNNQNDIQQCTPLKSMRENWHDCSIEGKLPEIPHCAQRQSISSDSEYERICDALKTNTLGPKQLDFEVMDVLNEFETINAVVNNKILSDIWESSVVSDYYKDENLTDPLALSPEKNKNSLPLNDEQSPSKGDSNRNESNKRRKSLRLKNNSNTNSEVEANKNNYLSDKYILKKIRKKVLLDKQEEMSTEILERLRELDIILKHKPLPQHQLETHLSRPPSAIIKKLFMQHETLKKGQYSQLEDDIIRKNWNRFCKINNWDPTIVKPFLSSRSSREKILTNEQRLKFVQSLANGLPCRSLYSVQLRFQLIFAKKTHDGPYTEEEDRKILIYMTNETKYSLKCEELAEVLGRTKKSVWNRYRLLKARDKKNYRLRKKIEWNVPLVERFLKYLLDYSLCNDIYDLKNAIISRVVWKKLEKKLEIPYDKMMNFWLLQLHTQLFYEEPIYSNDIKIKLIEYLYVKGISSREELRWSSIIKYFDGLTTFYLSRVFCALVHTSSIRNKQNLTGIIHWLYEKRIPQLKSRLNDNYLPRLRYTNGRIEVIDDFSD